MKQIFGVMIAGLAAALLPGAAHAQEVVCVMAAPPPPELAGWAARTPLPAARDAKGLRRAALVPGAAIDAALLPTPDVHYVVRPEKPGGSVSYGGLYALVISRPGTYRVALGAGAWIDLLKGKKAVVSTAHGHGPDCSGIRKMVDFPLARGRYVLQIAANGEAALPVMVALLP